MSVQYDRFRRDRYKKDHVEIFDMRLERENYELRGYHASNTPTFEVRQTVDLSYKLGN